MRWATSDLIAKALTAHDTPLFVFSEDRIRQAYRNVVEVFSAECRDKINLRVLCSVKNNPLLAIVRLLVEEGALFECSDLTEVKLLHRAGASPSTCLLTSLWKSEDEVAWALEANVLAITVDSLLDATTVSRVAESIGKRAPTLLRVNTGVVARRTRFHSAGPFGKAGARLEPAPRDAESAHRVIAELGSSPHVELLGLHAHVGSQVVRLADFDAHVSRLIAFLREAERTYGHTLSLLDVGGGFPVDYGREQVPTLPAIARTIGAAIAEQGFEGDVFIEPGRHITAQGGVLVTRVAKVRRNTHGEHLAILDASAYNVLLDSLVAGWRYPVRVMRGSDLEEHDADDFFPTMLVGATNDTLDVFGHIGVRTSKGGAVLEAGDFVIFETVGAYSVCFNMNYALLPSPPCLLVTPQGEMREIRPPESDKDVLARFGA